MVQVCEYKNSVLQTFFVNFPKLQICGDFGIWQLFALHRALSNSNISILEVCKTYLNFNGISLLTVMS